MIFSHEEIQQILDSPELADLIDQRAEVMIKESKAVPEWFTAEELAAIWKVKKKTVYRMSKDALQGQGYIKKRLGANVRFERISPRELYNRIKGKK